MREVTINRPVTVLLLAGALETKTFLLLAALIKQGIFLAPTHTVCDALAVDLAAEYGVRLRISDESLPEFPFNETPSPPEGAAEPLPLAGPSLPPHRQFFPLNSYLDPGTLSPDEDSAASGPPPQPKSFLDPDTLSPDDDSGSRPGLSDS